MYIQAPNDVRQAVQSTRIFLAGGISNCPVWQDEIAKIVDTRKHDLINPRRKGAFDNWGNIAAEQITWEHDAFTVVNACLFWFPKDTLCPITLFELGKQLTYVGHDSVKRPLIIGWDPEYKRAFDLEQQIRLEIKSNRNADRNVMYFEPGWESFCHAVQYYYG